MEPDHRDLDPVWPITVRVREAVRMIGLSRSRLYELLRDGEIEYAKVGRSTLILVESLRRFVESRVSSERRHDDDHHRS